MTRSITTCALVLLSSLFATGCATLTVSEGPRDQRLQAAETESEEEEFSQLLATMRHDLDRASRREGARKQAAALALPSVSTAEALPRLHHPLTMVAMPVQGLSVTRIDDSFGAPRDGGKRKHRGIDLFAPRGTPVLAVSDGYISFIGEQPKGGRCLWLSTEEGVAFYYAHLDRWASGIYEGEIVRQGEILGYVGNTGNAATTSPHLHFGVIEDEEALNPYPLLRAFAGETLRARPALSGGFTGGSHR
ncbi:MAG: M23 family metallopeptidase [Acidobacteriota bacterium]